jgi:hypothetical protein
VLDADCALSPVMASAEQMSGVSDVHVTMPPPDDGVARRDGPIINTEYDAAAPVIPNVRVRAMVVVVVVVAGTVVVGAGAGGAVVVVVVGDATVTTTVCGESTSVVCALPAVSVTENPAAAVRVELTGTSSAEAVDVAEIVHTVPEV